MASKPILQLDVVDVYGNHIPESVSIMLRNQNVTDNHKFTEDASKSIAINGLIGSPQGLYKIDVDPPSYQYVSQFINVKASGTTRLSMTFPIDPLKVIGVDFPPYAHIAADLQQVLGNSPDVLNFEQKTGQTLYDALDDIRKAGLLNIAIKSGSTTFANGRNVLSYIGPLAEVRGDRFFADVTKELLDQTKNSVHSGLFHPAGDILHKPKHGYEHAGSFKTPDHYGNLQLTFFVSGESYMVDIDIDDAAGLEHIFQVLRNKISGQPTHPYNIHEILVSQHLDPGYTFKI